MSSTPIESPRTREEADDTPNTELSREHTTDAPADLRHTMETLDTEPEPESTAAEDESRYPTGAKFYIPFLSACMILIITGIDSSIVAVAVPAITDHFHTVADVGWYSSAYKLCMCSFQFMFGKLYKLFSFKTIFLSSVAVFLLGSIICSTATSSLAFVVGRAVSGFAGAGIIAGCFTLVVKTLPLRKRPLFTSIGGAVEGLAVIAAPVLGGVLVQISWRWCFLINIPLSAIALVLVAVFLEDFRPIQPTSWKASLKELDVIGNLVFVPALTCLFMVLGWAGTKYPWNSPTIIALLCVFVVLLAAFAIDQWVKQDTATLPPRILKNRSVLAGFVFSLCCNGAMNVVEYYLPTWLQAVKEFSPQKSGYLMLPSVAGFLISTLLQGAGVNVVGYYVPFMLTGSILMPIFAGLMTTLTVQSSVGKVVTLMGFLGFACGIGFQSPQVAVQNSLPASDAGMGLAIILFAQSFGPAVFIAAAQTIFTNRLSSDLHHLAPGLNATQIENMGLSDLKRHIGPKNLHGVLLGLDRSLVQTWYLAVGLTCATMIGSASMEWRYVKQKRT